MITPWGKSQHVERHAEGISFVSTASHGGYHLSRKRLNQMPQYFRKECAEGAFFEEDCCWCVVPLSFLAQFDDKTVEVAKNTLLNWFPDLYELHNKTVVTPKMSMKRREEQFRRETVTKFVPRACWGDWEETTPKGFVTVLGERKADGATKYFLVPDDKYHAQIVCDDFPESNVNPTGRSKPRRVLC